MTLATTSNDGGACTTGGGAPGDTEGATAVGWAAPAPAPAPAPPSTLAGAGVAAAGVCSVRSGDCAGASAIGVKAVAMMFVGDIMPEGDAVAARALAAAEPTSH
jgi:hypothetical protein